MDIELTLQLKVIMKIFLFPVLFGLTACATIARGTSEQVAFDTIPSGAEVRVVIDNQLAPKEDAPILPPSSMGCVTPCVLQVKRHDKMVITITKPEFETEVFSLVPKPSGDGIGTSLVGNALIGGVVGLAVDGASGAGLDKCPNPVRIQLRRVSQSMRGKQNTVSSSSGFNVEEACKQQIAAQYREREKVMMSREQSN